MFGSGYENCPEFGVLGGVILKQGSVFSIWWDNQMQEKAGNTKGGIEICRTDNTLAKR
jgi:hypothetical protein